MGESRSAAPGLDDVGAILEALRAEVRARRSASAPGQSAVERELEQALDEIELYRVVSAHWPLTGRTPLQRAVALVNKVVRRGLRWYINPIVEQQNAYNDAVAQALRLLAEAYRGLGQQLAEARSQEPGAGNLEPAGQESADHDSEAPDVRGLMGLVRARGAAEPPARFPDVELRTLEGRLRLGQQVSAHWPLAARSVPERIAALAHKLQRRYLRWLVNPIVEQQNAANAAITAALLCLVRLDAERRAEAAALRAEKSKV